MKVVVIGGNGHIGTQLVPQLVREGHEVVNVSRGANKPYEQKREWQYVEQVTLDRKAAEQDGTFGTAIKKLEADVIMDVICYQPSSAEHLAQSIAGEVQHLISVGTIWVHGPSSQVPTSENQPRRPIGTYGNNKLIIEDFLLDLSKKGKLPSTIVHPGHVSGPGWAPLNPAGHFNPYVFEKLAKGETLSLPNFGLETVHHVHAADVAQLMVKAMNHWNQSVSESFHAVSPAAVTLRGFAEEVSSWFGHQADLEFLPFDEWAKTVEESDAAATRDHISRSPNCSIEKGRRLLGYEPKYTSYETVRESVEWLIDHGEITVS